MNAPSAENPGKSGLNPFFIVSVLVIGAGIGLTLTVQTTGPTNETFKSRGPSANLRVIPVAAIPQTLKSLHRSNLPGLQNVFRLGDDLYSGSSPTDEASFAALTQMGIRTIISVDAITPDTDTACAWALHYIHLPLKYSSISHDDLVHLVQAARTFSRPIYIHCQHGDGRGPAAAVALWRCLDQTISGEEAVAALKAIGIADQYHGLVASVRDAVRPLDGELTSVANLTEASDVEPLAKSMAVLNRMWDQVSEPAKDRDFITISNQLDTAYDIAEQFRESSCLAEDNDSMQTGFEAIVDDIEKLAGIIKCELRNPMGPVPERQSVVAAIKSQCNGCHARFRDGNSRDAGQVALRPNAMR